VIVDRQIEGEGSRVNAMLGLNGEYGGIMYFLITARGVAVDIPYFVYQFSFEPNYHWSRAFAEGQEINDYLHHCAKKYDIEKNIQFVLHRFKRPKHTSSGNNTPISILQSTYYGFKRVYI